MHVGLLVAFGLFRWSPFPEGHSVFSAVVSPVQLDTTTRSFRSDPFQP